MTAARHRVSHSVDQNRSVSNFRSADVSDSYNNFTYDDGKQKDTDYNNSTIFIMKYSADSNQFRSTQFFIFYQFQNRIYQSQQRPSFEKYSNKQSFQQTEKDQSYEN